MTWNDITVGLSVITPKAFVSVSKHGNCPHPFVLSPFSEPFHKPPPLNKLACKVPRQRKIVPPESNEPYLFQTQTRLQSQGKNEKEKVKLITGTMQRSPRLIRVACGSRRRRRPHAGSKQRLIAEKVEVIKDATPGWGDTQALLLPSPLRLSQSRLDTHIYIPARTPHNKGNATAWQDRNAGFRHV